MNDGNDPLRVFLVSLSLSQVREREQMITVTSGLTCSEQYKKFNPLGLLVKMMLDADAGTTGMLEAVIRISLQLLLPFLVGHYMRRWIGSWVDRNARW